MTTSTIKTSADGTKVLIGIDGVTKLTVGPQGIEAGSYTPGSVKNTDLAVVNTPSMVRVNTSNGYGSTNTKIRRFTNVVTNIGTDITYADSATLGGSFTINTSGIYSISYTDSSTGTLELALTVNDPSPTVGPSSVTPANILSGSDAGSANYWALAVWTGYLNAGDVIRAHTDGAAAGSRVSLFTIAKVA